MVACCPHKAEVGGSNPSAATMTIEENNLNHSTAMVKAIHQTLTVFGIAVFVVVILLLII